MESRRLKNIVILILLLLNVCLLGSLARREYAERSSRRRTEEQLVALFEASSVTLDADLIPRSTAAPAALTLTRSTDTDQSLAALLLGDELNCSDRGGGIYKYDNDAGAAFFRSNGSFEVVITDPPSGEAEALCREFCRSFQYEDLTFSLEEGTGTAMAVQYYNGYPVVNCTVTFTIKNDALQMVTGTHLPERGTEVSGSESLSAISALTIFLDTHRENRAVASTVRDIYLCYELQSSTATPLALAPAWCIVTDTGNDTVSYYVNCVAGSVTHN